MSLARIARTMVCGLAVAGVFAVAQAYAQGAEAAGTLGCRGAIAGGYKQRFAALGAPIRLANAQGEVRLTFVGHATFTIDSPGGVRAETDYNDYVRSGTVPDIATMNRAHSTHYSLNPASGIKHLLRGWPHDSERADHDIQLGDLRVFNVPTNIRDGGGRTAMGHNSIFVFDTGGLCIAHLGHLHHPLTKEHLAQLGKIDVLLVPVDGSYTLDIDGILDVVRAIGAPLVIPMHYFTRFTLGTFLERARATHQIDERASPSINLRRAELPATPTVIVLPGRH